MELLPLGNDKPVDVETRSFEIQEIMSIPPSGLLSWGITAIFFVILTLFVICYFIRYPEIISARVTLTSYTPPTSIIARNAGRLQLFVKDGQIVDQGAHLGLIESSANSGDVLELLKYFNGFKNQLFGNLNRDLMQLPENLDVGELQFAYMSFLKNVKEYDLFRQLDFYSRQMQVLENQIQLNLELDAQLKNQIALGEEDLFLAKKKLLMDSSLLANRAIAELEFDRTRSAYLSVKRNHELAIQNVTNNKIRRAELKSRIGELELQREEKISTFKNDISSSFKQLEGQLREWEQKYLLMAPMKGAVSFLRHRSNNQFLNAGEEIMKVIPESNDIFGEVLMPVIGSGKVEVGQRVNIKLDNYPYHEYGFLVGRIEAISNLPKENMYSIQVFLPNGLATTYKKHLPARQEMQGTAEIITKDLRLTDRIMNQFRSLIDKTVLSEQSIN